MKAEIHIRATSSQYSAFVGNQILKETLIVYRGEREWDHLFVLVDENVFRYHQSGLETLLNDLASEVHTSVIPEGEGSKSISKWEECVDFLLTNGVRRNTPLLVIGGGVTGDLGGFAAASAMRGIPLIHVPTTLLAMVDSSIGGKTSINHSIGKNLIGSFYQPELVVADISFLQTLPDNEWANGLSEILKYGAIYDDQIFSESGIFLDGRISEANSEKLITLIQKCITIKAEIVEKDEYESGLRAILNFGHTFAHALEKECGFEKISHGEAVYLGMLAAIKLSELTGGELSGNRLGPFRKLYSFGIDKDELSLKNLMRHMKSDKKRTGKDLKFVLLEAWQHPVVKAVNKEQLVRQAWNVLFDELNKG